MDHSDEYIGNEMIHGCPVTFVNKQFVATFQWQVPWLVVVPALAFPSKAATLWASRMPGTSILGFLSKKD